MLRQVEEEHLLEQARRRARWLLDLGGLQRDLITMDHGLAYPEP